MRIVPDDVMVESTSYCRILPDGSEQDINYIVESDTIELTDSDLDVLFIRCKNKAINDRRTFSQFLKTFIELKRAGK